MQSNTRFTLGAGFVFVVGDHLILTEQQSALVDVDSIGGRRSARAFECPICIGLLNGLLVSVCILHIKKYIAFQFASIVFVKNLTAA